MDRETRDLMRQWREAVRVLTGKGHRKPFRESRVEPRQAPFKALSGRPRRPVNIALVLHYRDGLHLGWFLLADRYRRDTGQIISKETAKRRYDEVKT